jgi:aminoglycoside phosphotransferase (APT) family kinase protein
VDVMTRVADLIRSNGFDVRLPVTQRSTNNVVVWLSPSCLVAKISTEYERAARELAVVRELVDLAAPVVAPVDLPFEQPATIDEKAVTFWRYEPQDNAVELDAAQIAEYLFRLHSKLASLRDHTALPSFHDRLMSAVDALERRERAPELPETDRALLRETLVDGMSRLTKMSGHERVIHGSPHRFNVLVVDATPSFIDFETVELGPVEWDLAHLEPEVAGSYPGEFDSHATLALCRVMVSAATSTWCWDGLARGSDMNGHAQHHLQVARSSRS